MPLPSPGGNLPAEEYLSQFLAKTICWAWEQYVAGNSVNGISSQVNDSKQKTLDCWLKKKPTKQSRLECSETKTADPIIVDLDNSKAAVNVVTERGNIPCSFASQSSNCESLEIIDKSTTACTDVTSPAPKECPVLTSADVSDEGKSPCEPEVLSDICDENAADTGEQTSINSDVQNSVSSSGNNNLGEVISLSTNHPCDSTPSNEGKTTSCPSNMAGQGLENSMSSQDSTERSSSKSSHDDVLSYSSEASLDQASGDVSFAKLTNSNNLHHSIDISSSKTKLSCKSRVTNSSPKRSTRTRRPVVPKACSCCENADYIHRTSHLHPKRTNGRIKKLRLVSAVFNEAIDSLTPSYLASGLMASEVLEKNTAHSKNCHGSEHLERNERGSCNSTSVLPNEQASCSSSHQTLNRESDSSSEFPFLSRNHTNYSNVPAAVLNALQDKVKEKQNSLPMEFSPSKSLGKDFSDFINVDDVVHVQKQFGGEKLDMVTTLACEEMNGNATTTDGLSSQTKQCIPNSELEQTLNRKRKKKASKLCDAASVDDEARTSQKKKVGETLHMNKQTCEISGESVPTLNDTTAACMKGTKKAVCSTKTTATNILPALPIESAPPSEQNGAYKEKEIGSVTNDTSSTPFPDVASDHFRKGTMQKFLSPLKKHSLPTSGESVMRRKNSSKQESLSVNVKRRRRPFPIKCTLIHAERCKDSTSSDTQNCTSSVPKCLKKTSFDSIVTSGIPGNRKDVQESANSMKQTLSSVESVTNRSCSPRTPSSSTICDSLPSSSQNQFQNPVTTFASDSGKSLGLKISQPAANDVSLQLENILQSPSVQKLIDEAKSSGSSPRWVYVKRHLSEDGTVVGPSLYLLKPKFDCLKNNAGR